MTSYSMSILPVIIDSGTSFFLMPDLHFHRFIKSISNKLYIECNPLSFKIAVCACQERDVEHFPDLKFTFDE